MPAHAAGFPATFLNGTPAPAVAATVNSSRGGGVGAPLDPTAALGWALQRQAVLLYAARSGLFGQQYVRGGLAPAAGLEGSAGMTWIWSTNSHRLVIGTPSASVMTSASAVAGARRAVLGGGWLVSG